VTPAIDSLRCAGATFAVDDEQTELREADHAENLAKLDFILPGYSKAIDRAALAGRVGFRPLSPDRLPMIGAVADAAAIDPARPSRPLAEMPRVPGLYLVNGFGARGIVWSALAGELLACLITGTPLPVAEIWSAPSIRAASCCAGATDDYAVPARSRRPAAPSCSPPAAEQSSNAHRSPP
jgi:tRNA 5-methylaminomethyl-2-thiouridine biosynthesis bifunctional protein